MKFTKPFSSKVNIIIITSITICIMITSVNLTIHVLQTLVQSNFSMALPPNSTPHSKRGILMSCPVVTKPNKKKEAHDGSWKPANPANGVQTVVQQLVKLNVTSLPLYFSYYSHERRASESFCQYLSKLFQYRFEVYCFLVRSISPFMIF